MCWCTQLSYNIILLSSKKKESAVPGLTRWSILLPCRSRSFPHQVPVPAPPTCPSFSRAPGRLRRILPPLPDSPAATRLLSSSCVCHGSRSTHPPPQALRWSCSSRLARRRLAGITGLLSARRWYLLCRPRVLIFPFVLVPILQSAWCLERLDCVWIVLGLFRLKW
jgi:hypothetical protein